MSERSFSQRTEEALQEAKEWFSKLELSNMDALCIYGIGLGYAYDAAKDWLRGKQERYLIFLEDDLAALQRFVETEKATEILNDPQVVFHHSGDIEWLLRFLSMLQIEVAAIPSYEQEKSDVYSQLRSRLLSEGMYRGVLAGDCLEYNKAFYKNFYPNLLRLSEARHGNRLFGAFQKVPAIICGAGPSLTKQLQLLKTLDKKALIFGAGSSLNALSSAHLVPHFGVSVCPRDSQRERLTGPHGYHVPLFYRNRANGEGIHLVHGPLLFLNGVPGFPIVEWVESQLQIEGVSVKEGLSVVSIALEVARHLGCDPIIFVGMDLAFTDSKQYAEGAVVPAESRGTHEHKYQEVLQRKDIHGNPIGTEWTWILEADWLATYAEIHPEHTFINATEGGMGIKGVPNVPFKEVVERYLQREEDLKGRVHTAIQKAKFSSEVNEEKIVELLNRLRISLEHSIVLTSQIIKELDDLSKQKRMSATSRNCGTLIAWPSKTEEHSEKSEGEDSSGYFGRSEMELEKEIAYKYILRPMLEERSTYMTRAYYQVERQTRNASELQKQLLTIDIKKEQMLFLRQAAEANLHFIH